jgi:hypothetical protein
MEREEIFHANPSFIPFGFLQLEGKKKWLQNYPSQNWQLPKM